MSKNIKLFNFNFMSTEQFKKFEIMDYIFTPISEKQLHFNKSFSSKDILKFNREMIINSFVSIPSKQKDTIIRMGSKYPNNRKVKFLDDILMIISILIGRNVVPRSYKSFINFPPFASNHCNTISRDSSELKSHLESVIENILNKEWQNKYCNGYHIKMLFNNSNIFVKEPRFLSYMTIWEYLYARENQNKSLRQIQDTCLDHKISFLLKKYLLSKRHRNLERKIKVFSVIRNQLIHSGDLPISDPCFNHLSYEGCSRYIILFENLTQLLVLKTLNIDAFDNLRVFNVKNNLEELSTSGVVNSIERIN